MFRQANFIQTVFVSRTVETNLKIFDNVEFTLQTQGSIHYIKDIKGDFQITKIIETGYGIFLWDVDTREIKFDKSSTQFCTTVNDLSELTFHITAKIELKEMCAVKYQLQIPSDRLQCLELYHFFKSVFVLPGYDDFKFKYYIKKIKETYEENDIEIYIENAYDIKIQGNKGNFKTFQNSAASIDFILQFTFYPNILDKPLSVLTDERIVEGFKEMCAVKYQLLIPSDHLQCLELYHYFKSVLVLPGYEALKFTYYVEKIKKTDEENDVALHIQNPYDVKIQGRKGDFIVVQNSTDSINMHLQFTFYPSVLDKLTTVAAKNHNHEEEEISEESESALNEPTHVSATNESRPESVISSQKSSNEPSTSKLFKIGSNIRFADVFFVTSDGKRIPSHRNILAEFSETFAQIFEETSEIPVLINVEDFEAEKIQSALHFLYDIPDAINGKEMEIFKFAVKFRIQDLIEACRHSFEESLSPSNVCEMVKLAYENNLEELKQKCLKILIQKKKEIDSTKVSILPQNILFDVYCFEC